MQDPTLTEPEAPEEGALVELVKDDHARRRFLKMVGGTGAASAFAVFVAACGSSSSGGGGQSSSSSSSSGGGQSSGSTSTSSGASVPKSDLAILNYALTLEYLESTFYSIVEQKNLFKGKYADVVKTFGQQEAQHVQALKKAISGAGGKPVSKPKFTSAFKALTKDKATALKAGAMVENVGAAAYLGAAPMIKTPAVLGAALSIHSVEARHAAALNQVLGTGFKGKGQYFGTLPDGAFAKPASMQTVLKIVKPFIAS